MGREGRDVTIVTTRNLDRLQVHRQWETPAERGSLATHRSSLATWRKRRTAARFVIRGPLVGRRHRERTMVKTYIYTGHLERMLKAWQRVVAGMFDDLASMVGKSVARGIMRLFFLIIGLVMAGLVLLWINYEFQSGEVFRGQVAFWIGALLLFLWFPIGWLHAELGVWQYSDSCQKEREKEAAKEKERLLEAIRALKTKPNRDRRAKRRARRSARALVILVLILPILYAVSFGPARALEAQGYLSEEIVTSTYTPLLWLAERWEWLDSLLKAHADDWTTVATTLRSDIGEIGNAE